MACEHTINSAVDGDGCCVACGQDLNEIAINDKKNAKLREALERIQTWANAYPLDIFPKPDLKKAAQVLKAADMTLDAISADSMRHVLDGVKDILEQALNED